VKPLRALLLLALLVVAVYAGYRLATHFAQPPIGDTVTVYYCKLDGETLVPWKVSLGPARDPRSVAFYATVQALAGPRSDVEAIRFPSGTVARRVDVTGSTAVVDLSHDVARSGGGSFAESGEFKALVWTLTSLPGVRAVQVLVDGRKLPTLPGGHLALDEPLTRSSW
jgi:germination protein M